MSEIAEEKETSVQNEENAQEGAKDTEKKKPEFNPAEVAATLRSGKLELETPIQDGENVYHELEYDFGKLTGLEMARAMDFGEKKSGSLFDQSEITEVQAISLFAAAAAKCQKPGGLDVTDIRDRLMAGDALTAIQLTKYFFKFSSLAGSRRISKK